MGVFTQGRNKSKFVSRVLFLSASGKASIIYLSRPSPDGFSNLPVTSSTEVN